MNTTRKAALAMLVGAAVLATGMAQAAVSEADAAKLIGKDNIHGWDFECFVHHGAGASGPAAELRRLPLGAVLGDQLGHGAHPPVQGVRARVQQGHATCLQPGGAQQQADIATLRLEFKAGRFHAGPGIQGQGVIPQVGVHGSTRAMGRGSW